MGRRGAARERWLPRLAPALLVVVATQQIALASWLCLNPWKGGGFGMFATNDRGGLRDVRAFALTLQAEEPLRIPAELDAERLRAFGLTLWTLACEAVIALAFLWQGRRDPTRLRDGALLLFLGTTFAFATVPGFGCLLAVLGAAQVSPDRRRARLLYVGAFLLVLSYRIVPWTSWLVSWD